MKNPFLPLPTMLSLHPAQLELTHHLRASRVAVAGGCIALNGPLNEKALRQAVQHLPVLFDVFRWQFDPACTNLPVTVGTGYELPELQLLDFSREPNPQQTADAWLQQRQLSAFCTNFHPFFDLVLLRLSATEHRLLVRGHQLLLDDTGCDRLMSGIARTYTRIIEGDGLPDPVPAYAGEVAAAQFYNNSLAYVEDEAHWQREFTELPQTLFPHRNYDLIAPLPYRFAASDSLSRTLRQAATVLNESPDYLLMAALTLFFARINNQAVCTFGRVVAGRQIKSQFPVVGRFDRLLPIRLRYQPELSLRLLVQRIRRQHRSDNSHRHFPMSHLSRTLGAVRSCLFDVLIQQQPAPSALTMPDLICQTTRLAPSGVYAPLHICWQEGSTHQPAGLQVSGLPNYISEGDARSLLVQTEHLLADFARRPDVPIASFEVLPRFIREYLSGRAGHCFTDKRISEPARLSVPGH